MGWRPLWLQCCHHAHLHHWNGSGPVSRIYEAEVAGPEAALSTIRPGATCGDVANAFNRTMAKMGFQKELRCGYPIGIDWTEPTASLKEGDRTELRANMTFHLVLGNWVDLDFGYVVSETFRVTGRVWKYSPTRHESFSNCERTALSRVGVPQPAYKPLDALVTGRKAKLIEQVLVDRLRIPHRRTCSSIHARCASRAERAWLLVTVASDVPKAGRGGGIWPSTLTGPVVTSSGEFASAPARSAR